MVAMYTTLMLAMVAYFCHHLSDNYVDLSENYIDLSDYDVDLSDIKLYYTLNKGCIHCNHYKIFYHSLSLT